MPGQGPPLDRVVPAVRDVDLPARAHAGWRLPGEDRPLAVGPLPAPRPCGRVVVVWTTTPWTLPANVAAAVRPEAEYGRREHGEWVAVARYPDDTFVERAKGAELVGWRYRGPFDDAPRPATRWSTASSRGTRSRSRRGLASSTSRRERAGGLRALAVHDLPVLTPVDESGRFYDAYGWLHGLSRSRPADQIVGDLRRARVPGGGRHFRAPLSALLALRPPLIFRLADDWFIAVDELRQPLLDANARSSGRPSTWASAWTTGSGTWGTGTSRGGATTVSRCRSTSARAATSPWSARRRSWPSARPRARPARGAAAAVDRCRADPLRGVRRGGRRIAEVGDVWLDAGIVPFSTLGWQNAEFIEGGYATGAAQGLDDRRPPRPRVLGGVVPRRLGLRDARADPALVLLAAVHVGRTRRARAVPKGARLREDARRARAARCTARGGT